MTIKRYEVDNDGCGYFEHDDGDWCRWGEVEKELVRKDMAHADNTEELRAENSKLRERLEAMRMGFVLSDEVKP